MLTRRHLVLGVGACSFAAPAWAQAAAVPPDATIRDLLIQRIDRERQSVGIVVGVSTPEGRRIVGHGRLAQSDPRTPDGDTVYEIGSLTKVFANYLFADMVRRGEIGLEDPLARHLPPTVTVPQRNGRTITLLDLATHTAGLPSFPGVAKVPPGAPDWVFPWYLATADFHEAELYDWLTAFRLSRDPGASWEYSNSGTTLLALAVCRRAGTDFATLLRRRVLAPLKLRSTGLEPTGGMKRRLVTGHEADMVPAPRWNLGVLALAGGMLSTPNDLMTFTDAIAPGADSPLSASAEVMLRHRRPMPGGEQAMGWEVLKLGGEPLLSKGGLTRGCGAALLHDPATKTTLVALANSDRPATDIARHLLRPSVPLARTYVAVPLRPDVLEACLGRYDMPVGPAVSVVRMGRGVGLRYGASPPGSLTPVSDTTFVTGNIDVEFRRGADGSIDRIAIRRPNIPETVGARAKGKAAP